jgi:hypothetical protein
MENPQKQAEQRVRRMLLAAAGLSRPRITPMM